MISLRKHVYNFTEKENELPVTDSSAMETLLKEKRIIIIGGHDNWTYKLKNKFRNWEFLTPGASGTINSTILSHADYIYFFTDYISHSTYSKFMNIVREQNLTFGYIHTVNIKANIRQIYYDLLSLTP